MNSNLTSGKQIMRVLAAVTEEGCETANDVADATGMSVAGCSTYLGRLARLGCIRATERYSRVGGRGRPARHYEPVDGSDAP
jgi:predicted ArsR family transcriptional regulator